MYQQNLKKITVAIMHKVIMTTELLPNDELLIKDLLRANSEVIQIVHRIIAIFIRILKFL